MSDLVGNPKDWFSHDTVFSVKYKQTERRDKNGMLSSKVLKLENTELHKNSLMYEHQFF